MEKTVFVKNLKAARKRRSWSQQGAADHIGISRSRLASYESGRTEPDQETLQAICNAYGIDDIRGFLTDGFFFDVRRTAEEIHRRYAGLSGAARRAVDALLGLS